MMLREELLIKFDAAIEKAELAEHRDALLAVAKECVHFNYGEPVEELPIGASRVGGSPDLPESMEWPAGILDGKPSGKASFFAQFDLAELPEVEGLPLPPTGHLYLFISDATGHEKVATALLCDSNQVLHRRASPSDELPCFFDHRHNSRLTAPLRFSSGVSMPFSSKAFERQHPELPSDGMEDFMDALGGELDRYGSRDGIDGQIGGYSYQAEVDLCREIAFQQLGRPDHCYADVGSMARLEELIASRNPFIRPDDPQFEEKQEQWREKFRKMIPQMRWIEAHEAQIATIASSIHLLCMFRPSWKADLEFGDGMYLDFLVDNRCLETLDFDEIYCRLPMLL